VKKADEDKGENGQDSLHVLRVLFVAHSPLHSPHYVFLCQGASDVGACTPSAVLGNVLWTTRLLRRYCLRSCAACYRSASERTVGVQNAQVDARESCKQDRRIRKRKKVCFSLKPPHLSRKMLRGGASVTDSAWVSWKRIRTNF
jgi:hypothetical protein